MEKQFKAQSKKNQAADLPKFFCKSSPLFFTECAMPIL
jgi:hypothetical protein